MILKGDKLIEEFEGEYEIHYSPSEGKWSFDEEDPEKIEGIFSKIIRLPFTILGYLLREDEGDKRRERMNNIRNIMLHLDIYSTSELKENDCEFPWSDVLVCPTLDESHDISYPELKDVGYTKEELEKIDLLRIDFRSPSSTWENMCGIEGILYICKKRKQQIYFLCTMMN
jgi:hypothetical protein